MYFFPRECPRILLWPTPRSTDEHIRRFWRGSSARMIAFIEAGWAERHAREALWRYEFDAAGFNDVRDVGMWVSRETVRPIGRERIGDLPARLAEADVELRVLPDLLPLKNVWETSLHASGIRLRNAQGWI